MRGNAMSQSFSSHAGRLWANQQLPHVPNNADRDTIRLLADNFDGTGFCSRSVRNLCADGGNHRGLGAMLRSLNTLEHLGRIIIGRRGGGSHQGQHDRIIACTPDGGIVSQVADDLAAFLVG
jgi:hypothetical protein